MVFLILVGTAGASTAQEPVTAGWFEDFFRQQMQEHAVVGSAMVVVQNGQVLAAHTHGWAHRDSGTTINADYSVFPVGAVSKLLTHAAVLHLAQQGRVDLDAPAADYIRSIDLRQPYQTPLTVRHLLTHQDGYETRALNTVALSANAVPSLRELLDAELPPAVRRPGSAVTYGAYGAALLGLLVEEVSGVSFADYVAEHIFRPLGMQTASFQPVDAETQQLVRTYYWQDSELHMAPRLFSQLPPSSGLHMAASDAAALLAALTQVEPVGEGEEPAEGGEAAAAETAAEPEPEPAADDADGDEETAEDALVEEAPEPVRPPRSWNFTWNADAAWLQELLPVQVRAHEQLPGISYGFMESFKHGQTILRRPGTGMGVYSEVVVLPDVNAAIFYVQNTRSSDAFQALFDGILQQWFPNEDSLLPNYTGPMNTDVFTGTYRPVQSGQHTLVKMETLVVGELQVKASGSHELTITPLSIADTYGGFGSQASTWRAVGPLAFQQVGGEALISFEEDAKGGIVALHSTSGYHGSYQPIARWQAGPFQLSIILGSLLVLALNIVVVPVKLIIRRGWRPLQPVPFTVRLVPWWSLLVSLFFVGGAAVSFYALFWREVAGMPAFAAGVSQMAQTGLAFLISGVGVLGVLILLLLAVWRDPSFHTFSRFWQSIVILAGATASIWLWHWNFLGTWF